MELTLDQALQKGIEAHKAGKVQEADRYYTAILKANPKHPDANHNMGVLAVGVSKVERALPFFKTALEANPKIDQFWLSYIDALVKLDRMDDAKSVFEQAKSNGATGDVFDQLEKRFGKATFKNSNIQDPSQNELNALIKLYNQNKLMQVYDEAQKLTKRYTKSHTLWNLIGAAASQIERVDDAIFAFQKTLSVNPDNVEAYNNIGVALQNQGKLEEAIEAFIKALSIKPDFAEAYYNMGNALEKQGKLDEAIKAYKKAISLKPDYANSYYNIGVIFRHQGKLDEAIKVYKKAISYKPDYANAYYNIGVIFKDQGKLDEAIKAYNKALAIKPDYAGAHNNIGVIFKEKGKLKEATEAFNKATSIKPDFAEAHYNMGNALHEQGKIEEAIKVYQKANTIKPDHWSAKHMLSALTGNKTETAPREYVENLFDGYSKNFEASLVKNLEYKTPKLIKDLLIKPNSNESLGSVLDLGCGTGLLGQEIKNYCSRLEGVDLSSKMLDLAKQKNVYDKLSHLDIVEYLSSKPLDFDYYIALDVFIYVGELSEIFRLIKSQNKTPGKLVFSTEHTERDGYHIRKTGRYSHSKTYIESLCKEFGYKMSHFSTTELRKEQNSFLTGGIYLLSFRSH